MDIRKTGFNFFRIIFLLFFIFFTEKIYSQEKQLTQKLEWEKELNALEYKVEIEGITDLSINEYFITKNEYIELSLTAGRYKYRIIAFDFLGRLASVSPWKDFVVYKALKPNLIIDERLIINTKDNGPIKIPLQLSNVTEDTLIIAKNILNGEEIQGIINLETENFSRMVTFPSIYDGQWNLYVENPCGLYTQSDVLHVLNKTNKVIISKEIIKENLNEKSENIPYNIKDIYILAGINLPLVVFNEYIREFSNENFYLLPAFDLKSSWLFKDIDKIQLGVELNLGIKQIYDHTFYSDIALTMGFCQLNFIGRYNFINEKLAFNLKLGAGASGIFKTVDYFNGNDTRIESDDMLYIYPCVQGGVSFSYFFVKYIIMEIGVDVTCIFSPDMNIGIVSPYLSVGVRF